MKNLKNDIKLNSFKNVYLLFGEENYLIRYYANLLQNAVVNDGMADMNVDKFEGKSELIEKIINAAETPSFLSDIRLILVKESGLFTTGRKNDSETMAEYVKNVPESTIIIFIEKDVDKRSRIFKRVNELGRAVEMKPLEEKHLITWIQQTLKKSKKTISPSTAAFFIRYVNTDMDTLYSELEKLTTYKGDYAEINTEDIESVCIKSLETKIFGLVAAIGNKDPETALDIYSNLLLMKESPIMVLTMIARQFRLILYCAHLSQKGMTINGISEKLTLRSFIVKDCLTQSRHFSIDILKRAMTDCLETDIAIKTGKMGDKLAVELLIIQYASNKIKMQTLCH